MAILDVSYNTQEFEVRAEFDEKGRITHTCTKKICEILDKSGFVIIPHLLSDQEAKTGLKIVNDSIADPNREMSSFASQTDIRYRRRDFCPLPSTKPVISYATMLCQRLENVLGEYCGRTRQVLEISTMTSYFGSSHQYIHSDPEGVLCMFVAVDNVSPTQGGTLFVPGTHKFSGADMQYNGKVSLLMHLYQALSNFRILRYNLTNLWRIRKVVKPPILRKEFIERLFSRCFDNHQPNLARFILGKNAVFSLNFFDIFNIFRNWKAINETFRLVKTSPEKGTVILYRSDMLHAGPDNQSQSPRFFFGMSIARDIIFPKQWRDGYSPHASLLSQPISLSDLLDSHESVTNDYLSSEHQQSFMFESRI
jgi:ectoine hydroxylase-related dioxygenase (phytanoyl-CoA dioxygenase family)